MTENRIRVPKGQGDEIETPPWLFDYLNRIFRFDADICATWETSKLGERYYPDALTTEWTHRVGFMNPPYSNPAPFLEAAAHERLSGRTTVALIKGDSATVWWNRYVRDSATLIWWPRRIRFYYKGRPTKDAANFPSVIALYLPLANGEPPPKGGEWFLP